MKRSAEPATLIRRPRRRVQNGAGRPWVVSTAVFWPRSLRRALLVRDSGSAGTVPSTRIQAGQPSLVRSSSFLPGLRQPLPEPSHTAKSARPTSSPRTVARRSKCPSVCKGSTVGPRYLLGALLCCNSRAGRRSQPGDRRKDAGRTNVPRAAGEGSPKRFRAVAASQASRRLYQSIYTCIAICPTPSARGAVGSMPEQVPNA
jgi:hypothetical protein